MVADRTLKKRRFFFTAVVVYLCCIGFTLLIEHWEERSSALNPIHIFFKESDFTDVYYHSNFYRVPPAQIKEIVVINAMCANRKELARLISIIRKSEPDVIGLDFNFVSGGISGSKSEATDSLNEVIRTTSRLVLGYAIPQKGTFFAPREHLPNSPVVIGKNITGFINIADNQSTIRAIPVNAEADSGSVPSFALAMAQTSLGNDQKELHEIESDSLPYRFHFLPHESFQILNGEDILHHPGIYVNTFHGKNVIIGECDTNNNSCGKEDKHFTPLNSQMAGRSFPDMEGVFIHANILRSLLSGEKIVEIGKLWVILISLICCLPLLGVLMFVYCRPHHIYHFFMVLIYEPVVLFLFIFISIFLFYHHIYLSFSFPYLMLTVSPFVIYIVDLLDIGLDYVLRKWFGLQGSPSFFKIYRVDHFKSPKHEKSS